MWALVAALADLGDVRVYAPDRNYSGAGMSIMMHDEFDLIPAQPQAPCDPSLPAFTVAAPPAQVAAIACAHAFPDGPDLVVSGINGGWNPGNQTYVISGTVGAARVAIDRGTTGIGVSAAPDSQADYATIAAGVVRLIQALHAAGRLGAPVLININAPAGLAAHSPVVLTTPARFTYFERLQLSSNHVQNGVTRVRLKFGDYFDGRIRPGDEADALRSGAVSISITRPFEARALLDDPWPAIAAAFRTDG